MQKYVLRLVGVLGSILFIPLFILTFINPQWVEKSGQAFIEWKLNNETHAKINSIALPKPTKFESLLAGKSKALRVKAQNRLAVIKDQLKKDAPSLFADQLAKLRKLDCECRKLWENKVKTSLEMEIYSLQAIQAKIITFTQMKYMEIVTKLTIDIRIFLGTNGFIFMFLLLLSFVKPQAVKHLFLPCGLLCISTLICSYFYLFEQNWFYTIIYNDYTGFSFITYLGMVFALLCDIAFNKAKVTTKIINGIMEGIGHSLTALAPC